MARHGYVVVRANSTSGPYVVEARDCECWQDDMTCVQLAEHESDG